jgi:uncharacterized protein YaaR (DUF327 family)
MKEFRRDDMQEQDYTGERDNTAPVMTGSYQSEHMSADENKENMSGKEGKWGSSSEDMQEKKENDNLALLKEIYQSCMMGKQAISTLIPKVDDQNFKDDLITCYNEYDEMCNKAATEIMKMGEKPREKNPLSKAMMWGTLNISTAIDNRISCLADVVVKGGHNSVNNMTRAMNQYSENIDSQVRQLADEFMQNEKDNIQKFQKYL